MHSYIPLQANHRSEDLMEFDNLVIDTIKKSHGLTCSDAKHRLLLPHKAGGCGLTSATEIDIVSVARELEIVSNSGDLDSFAFRTRIAAIHNHDYDTDNELHNHARCAIRKLSRYGIHFRDSSDGLINDILRHFEQQLKYATIGNHRYSNGNSHNVGLGKACNHLLSYGGPVHTLLLKFQRNNWNIGAMENNCDTKSPIKIKEIASLIPKIKLQKIQNISATFSCWEWISTSTLDSGNSNIFDKPQIDSNWNHISPSNDLQKIMKNINWNKDIDCCAMEQVRKLLSTVDMKDFILQTSLSISSVSIQGYSRYASVFNAIINSKSPIIVATDGSCRPRNETSNKTYIKASSAFTVGILDIRNDESLESSEWTDRPIIPLLCRTSALPNMMGASETDIAVAECHAFLMEELCLPNFLPRILVTDSEAIRYQVIYARDLFDGSINRNFIRSQIGGISKSIMCILATVLRQDHDDKEMTKTGQDNQAITVIVNLLKERNAIFLNVAKTWTVEHKTLNPHFEHVILNANDPQSKDLSSEFEHSINKATKIWRKSYFDDHAVKPVLKVNSHQLCDKGLTIKVKSRYPSLIPNLCLLNANHIADTIAEFPFSPSFLKQAKSLHSIYNPPSPLRFYITVNGNTVDKHISDAINNSFVQERLKRLKTKPTQGMLWRLIQYVYDWNSLNLHRGLLRSLYGLSRTHTRCLYKSNAYREGCWKSYSTSLSKLTPTPKMIKTSKIDQIKTLSPCKWCPSSTTPELDHGNRMHAINSCGHPDLAQFRSSVDILLIKKFQELFHELKQHTSDCSIRNLLFQVQNIFIKLQASQEGRLQRVSSAINNTYLSIECLLAKNDSDNFMQCMLTPESDMCLAIFGLRPHNINKVYNNDANIGVIDAPWLGLIPKEIDSCVQDHLRQSHNTDVDSSGNISTACEDLINMWKGIKGIIMGRASGLHKVIGTASTARELFLKNTFEIDIGTRKELKRKISPPKETIKAILSDLSPTSAVCNECTRIGETNSQFSSSPTILDICNGISCNRNLNE